jgi:hypothetical protein
VVHTAKSFSAKLNKCLDDLDVPENPRERASILSKMLDLPRQQAWGLIEGTLVPDEDLAARIAEEMEVELEWLFGEIA